VGNLESLETVASLGFLSNDIEDWIDKFSTLGVMSLSPVVSSSSLTENEVIGSE
jgi:hypothetical protein